VQRSAAAAGSVCSIATSDFSTLAPDHHPTPPLGTRKRLLLVEDDPLVRSAMTRVLRLHDYDVHTAGTVAEAIDELHAFHFFAVIVDYRLGTLTGVELLASVSGIRPVPIRILMSAAGPPVTELHERRIFDAFLVKPFALGALIELLSRPYPRR
jgi:DNA-binding NtrC family response regulator